MSKPVIHPALSTGSVSSYPSFITTHTTPEQRLALREQIQQLRSDVYRLMEMADQRFPSYPKLAVRSIEAMETFTGLMIGALWKETMSEYQARKAQGEGA